MAGASALQLIGFGEGGWGWQFLAGTVMTVEISVCGYVVGMVLGLLGAWARLSHAKPARWLGDLYTTLVRAVPELLLIILLYYTGTTEIRKLLVALGAPPDIQVNAFAAAVATLGFVQGAYLTEIMRGAIQAVPRGVMEAGRSLALRPGHRFRLILFPLMIRYALPGMSNQWLAILKDSSLISVVGFSELLFTGKTAASSTKHYFLFYLFTAILFLALTLVSNLGIRQIQRRVNRGYARA